MKRVTVFFFFGIATLAVACGSNSSGNPPTPEQDAGTDTDSENRPDAETPTSWTRSYESLSFYSYYLQGGAGSIWQSAFCVDDGGRVFFPGASKTFMDRESDGVMLGASGDTLWSMRADWGLNLASCDENGVSFAAQARSQDFHVADGVVSAPPGIISPELVAAVDDSGHLVWGKLMQVGGTGAILRTQGRTTWTIGESSEVDVGCGPIPSAMSFTPESGRSTSDVMAEFDDTGACLWSRRLIQHTGMSSGIVVASGSDGAGGNVVLWGKTSSAGELYYDAALEHYDATGESVWVTKVFNKFGDYMVGYLARSESGYFLGRMLGFSHDAIITKISSDGQEQWTKTIGTWENGRLWGFAPDADGGLLIGGRFEHIDGDGKAQLCGKTYEIQGDGDGFAARLDDQGNCTWVRLFATPRFDQVNAIAASRADGAVVVAWEDWPKGQRGQVEPIVNMHITKFVPEHESP